MSKAINHKLINKINLIANMDINVFIDTPIFLLLKQRKICPKKLRDEVFEADSELFRLFIFLETSLSNFFLLS
jgi:hypothetical protein